MKNILISCLFFAPLLFSLTTLAAAEPPILYGAPISVELARKAASAAIAEGKKNQWPIAVAIVDPGGHLVYFERVDGTQTGSLDLAIEKAKTAVAYKRTTKELEDRIVAGRLQYLRQGEAIPIEGGEPIINDGKVVGGIGVSGVRSQQDGVCAKAGVTALAPKAKSTGMLNGRLLLKSGEPLAGGKVNLFREGSGPAPSQNLYWRTPDEIATIDNEGRFTVKLSEGRYFISAIKKMSRDLIGPPTAGDLVYPDYRKELKSELQTFLVKSGETTDIGTIAEAVPFKKHATGETDTITAIEGKITDPQGKPVAGAIVFAFASPNLVGKPLFVSERTGADGNYTLNVASGGDYYLKTRTSLTGGQPVLGELIGIYGTGKAKPVKVKTGEKISGIEMMAKPLSNKDLMEGKSDVPSRKPDGSVSGPGRKVEQ